MNALDEGVDLQRGQKRLAEMGITQGTPPSEPVVTNGNAADPLPPRKRARRSDAGKARDKAQPGVNSTDFQWRVEELMQAEAALRLATMDRDRKWADYCAFVDEALRQKAAE